MRVQVTLLLIVGSGIVLACAETQMDAAAQQTVVSAESLHPVIPPPLVFNSTAYEAAGSLVTLDVVPPQEFPGLHHVFSLSDNIISGAEPDGDRALAEIASMGVKTILSVDGKAPDVETARDYGMRYVHVPIQYKGISTDELLVITKTFREAEGPFYVHCFHGKHRGPAAAAVGRLVIDGLSREQGRRRDVQ